MRIYEERRQFEVNLFGLSRLTQLVLPQMRKQKSGKIIHTSSAGGKIYTLLIVAQLIHAGKLALPAEIGENDVIAPSSIPTKRPGYAIPKEITNEQAERIINDFYEATKRAIKAGFDGVELHGANGYLIQQFFSPYSNLRKDQWGGTIQNRLPWKI